VFAAPSRLHAVFFLVFFDSSFPFRHTHTASAGGTMLRVQTVAVVTAGQTQNHPMDGVADGCVH
jgi:hypothetical protein